MHYFSRAPYKFQTHINSIVLGIGFSKILLRGLYKEPWLNAYARSVHSSSRSVNRSRFHFVI